MKLYEVDFTKKNSSKIIQSRKNLLPINNEYEELYAQDPANFGIQLQKKLELVSKQMKKLLSFKTSIKLKPQILKLAKLTQKIENSTKPCALSFFDKPQVRLNRVLWIYWCNSLHFSKYCTGLADCRANFLKSEFEIEQMRSEIDLISEQIISCLIFLDYKISQKELDGTGLCLSTQRYKSLDLSHAVTQRTLLLLTLLAQSDNRITSALHQLISGMIPLWKARFLQFHKMQKYFASCEEQLCDIMQQNHNVNELLANTLNLYENNVLIQNELIQNNKEY